MYQGGASGAEEIRGIGRESVGGAGSADCAVSHHVFFSLSVPRSLALCGCAGKTMSASMQLQVAAAVPAELFTQFHPKVLAYHTSDVPL
jgi:hypothetical protein